MPRRALPAAVALLALTAGCDRRADPRAEDASTARGRAERPGSTTRPLEAEKFASASAVPVVVELFSSEGCSSCPPADRVLAELSSAQGIEGVEVIALEMHVDYWNDIGWVDPFSDARFSDRQRGYARLGARRGVFTPEAIVDGAASVVGSDRSLLSSTIRRAGEHPHVRVDLARRDDGIAATLHGHDGGPLESGASVWIAVTESGLETDVPSGENGGKTLRHAPVVRALERVGPATEGARDVAIPRARTQGGPLVAVVLVQRDEDQAILGAGRIPLAAD